VEQVRSAVNPLISALDSASRKAFAPEAEETTRKQKGAKKEMAVNRGMRAAHLLTGPAVVVALVKPVSVNKTHFAVKWSGMPPAQVSAIPRVDNAGARGPAERSMGKDALKVTSPGAMDAHVKTAYVNWIPSAAPTHGTMYASTNAPMTAGAVPKPNRLCWRV